MPFATRPLYLTEFSSNNWDPTEMVAELEAFENSGKLAGIYYHELVTSQKGGAENNFGLFNVGSTAAGEILPPVCGAAQCDALCLKPTNDRGQKMALALATYWNAAKSFATFEATSTKTWC